MESVALLAGKAEEWGLSALQVMSYLNVYSYGSIHMGIPMASGLGSGFSSKLPTFPMGIPTAATGLGRGFSLKLPALFLWIAAKEGVFFKVTNFCYEYSYG